MYMTITEAAREIGCSLSAIRLWVTRRKLEGKYVQKGKRQVLVLSRWSVYAFKEANKNNTRIGRELRCRPYRRKPVISKGYRLVFKPEHPRAFFDGMVYEHVLVMESVLGRELSKTETVHHINRIRSDNRPENLKLYSSRSEHMREAHSQEIKDKLSKV